MSLRVARTALSEPSTAIKLFSMSVSFRGSSIRQGSLWAPPRVGPTTPIGRLPLGTAHEALAAAPRVEDNCRAGAPMEAAFRWIRCPL